MNIGQTIASMRERMGLSQKELAALLQQNGVCVTNQAISKWETGITQPNASQFLVLCQALHIDDILYTFTDRGDPAAFSMLNQEGQKKAREYIDLLIRSGLYTSKNEDDNVIKFRSLPLYNIAVSAGTGQFLDSDNYDLVEVGSEVPMTANFGVRIAGDSMQPRFIDGQVVWVHQQQTIQSGEIGIFLYNGNAYCKKLLVESNGIQLLSLNHKYPPIQILPDYEFRVFGKVVG